MTTAAPAAGRRPGPPLSVGRDDAAAMAGLSRRTLPRGLAAAELLVRRLGRGVLVRPADLAERIERGTDCDSC